MNAVAAGKDVDEFGDNINNVEKVLRSYGIELRDITTNQFRPLGDVLDELNTKWGALGTTQKAQIAGAMGGVRQYSNVIALMDNYNQVLEAQQIETEAAGLSTQRFGIYLEGLEAAMNRSKAAWEGVWQATIKSDSIKWFYNLSTQIAGLVKGIGGFGVVVATVGFVLLAFSGKALYTAALSVKTFFQNIIIAVRTLFTLQTTAVTTAQIVQGAMGLIGIILAVVTIAWGAIANSAQKAEQRIQEINQSIDAHRNKLESLVGTQTRIAALWKEYEILAANTKKTNDEEARFVEIQQEIHSIVPTVAGDYNSLGQFTLDAATSQKSLNDETQRAIDLEREQLTVDVLKGLQARTDQLKGYQDEVKNATEFLKKWEEQADKMEGRGEDTTYLRTTVIPSAKIDVAEQEANVNAWLIQERINYMGVDDATRKLIVSQYNLVGIKQELIDYIIGETTATDDLNGAVNENATAEEKAVTAAEKATKAYAALTDILGGLAVNDELAQSLEEINQQLGLVGVVGGFDKLDARIRKVSRDLQVSQTGFKNYFNGIKSSMKGIDLTKMFGGDKKAASSFMSTMLADTKKQVLALGKAFESETISLGEYNESVYAAGDSTLQLLQTQIDSAEALGLSEESVDALRDKYGDLTDEMATLRADQSATIALEQAVANTQLQTVGNSQRLAQMIVATGMTIKTTEGVVLTSADAIAKWLLEDVAHFAEAALQMAQETANAVAAILAAVGTASQATQSGGGGGGGASAQDNMMSFLNMVVAMIRQEKEAEKEALQERIDAYAKIINAKKKALELAKDELEYQEKLAEQQKDAADLQGRIEELALDDSEEAKAKRLELEAELADQKTDIAKTQRDEQYENEQAALDNELKAFTDRIQAMIDAIDEYLSKPGQIMRDAIKMVENDIDGVYNRLLAWNRVYGTGIDADVTKAYIEAKGSLEEFLRLFYEGWREGQQEQRGLMPNQPPPPPNQPPPPASTSASSSTWVAPQMKSEGGLISGGTPNEDSVPAMLTPGEFVIKKAAIDAAGLSALTSLNSGSGFSPSSAPSSVSQSSGNNLSISTLLEINVGGSLDKSVVPQIQDIAKQVVKELNKNLMTRGVVRSANQFSA